MAELVGVFAASHAPLIVRAWDTMAASRREALESAFRQLGERFQEVRPDVLIEISPDHWLNFFLDNLPGICVGVGKQHGGPPEPWMKEFGHAALRGHPGLARHLVSVAVERDFEPAVSHNMKLDHGFCVPLWKAGLTAIPPIVPVVINTFEHPSPSLRRCLEWGSVMAEAIASYPENLRVAVLATGGLSHAIGEPRMGEINEAFDRECIERFADGDGRVLVDFLRGRIPEVGNGAEEIRNWLAAHGAAGRRGFELLGYCAVPEVYVGCGFAAWNVARDSNRNSHGQQEKKSGQVRGSRA